jgi:hypothetical protein
MEQQSQHSAAFSRFAALSAKTHQLCRQCKGKKMVPIHTDEQGKRLTKEQAATTDKQKLHIAMKRCRCVIVEDLRARLSVIPERFQDVRLCSLKPDAGRHYSQVVIITELKQQPLDSWLFTGKHGTGKSHFAWALARHAMLRKRKLVACNLDDLLLEFRNFEFDREAKARITADTLLNSNNKFCLVLQEFDKPKPTEFASKILFNLIDAAYNNKHQLIVTSNKTIEGLHKHWSTHSPEYGTGIMRRIGEMCLRVAMF